jgi:hypothetical protein
MPLVYVKFQRAHENSLSSKCMSVKHGVCKNL